VVFVGVSSVATVVYLQVVTPAIGVSFADAALNYPFAFFFWGMALLSFFDCWPFAGRIPQPWAGLATAALSLIPAVLTWKWLAGRFGEYDAFALLSYAEFFLFAIAWFYDNAPAAGLRQPVKGLFLTGLSIALGWAVYTVIGAIPQMWLYYIPEWLLFFFGSWPIGHDRPYARGTFWVVLILAGTWLTNGILTRMGAPVTTARGEDVASIVFGSMIYTYGFECWPFERIKQPLKGIVVIATTLIIALVLAVLAWRVFQVEDHWVSAWVFAVWTWLVVLLWMIAPWPSQGDTSA